MERLPPMHTNVSQFHSKLILPLFQIVSSFGILDIYIVVNIDRVSVYLDIYYHVFKYARNDLQLGYRVPFNNDFFLRE